MNYYLKALEFYKKKELNAAQKILQMGLLKSEKPAEAYHLLGVIMFQQGFFRNSIKQFQKACRMENNPEYFLNLSIALNEIGNYEEAQTLYNKAIRLKHHSEEKKWKEEVAKKHCQTAQIYLKKNNWKSALNEYLNALQFHPEDLNAQIQVATLLWKLGQQDKAINQLKQIVSVYPQLTPARLLLAEWFIAKKNISQAVGEWKFILQMEPENKAAKNALLKFQKIKDTELNYA